jgi:DNA polymerase-1
LQNLDIAAPTLQADLRALLADCEHSGIRLEVRDGALVIVGEPFPSLRRELISQAEGLVAYLKGKIELAPTPAAPLPATSTGAVAEPTSPAAEEPAAPATAGPAPIVYRLLTDAEEAIRAIGEIGERVAGLDTETTGLDPLRDRPRLLQLATGGGDPVVVIDLFAVPIDAIRPALAGLHAVAHNAVFDMKMLHAAGVAFEKPFECALLLNQAMTGEMESLAALAKRHIGLDLQKDYQSADWSGDLSAEQIRYAALDAEAVRCLADELKHEVARRKATAVYRLMRDAQPAVVGIELAGFGFDLERHARLVVEAMKTQNALRWELRRIGMSKPDSSRAVALWLERRINGAKWPRTDSGQLSTDSDALRFYGVSLPEKARAGVGLLERYREAIKRVSTYGMEFASHVHPDDGRIHAQYLLGGAVTGRMSCRAPNLQNVPRDPLFRDCFRVSGGRILVAVDFGQIELRVAAFVANEPTLLDAFNHGVDVHKATAARLLKKPIESISKEERQSAKVPNFGLLYGQGPLSLMRYARTTYGVVLTELEAKKLRAAWFNAFPKLRAWQRRQQDEARRLGSVRTPSGRTRMLEGERAQATSALNTPIQGGAAEAMLAALARLPKVLASLGAKLVAVVHDEVVVEAPEASATEVAVAVEAAMTEGFLAIFPNGPTSGLVEAQSGRSWSEAKA